MKIAFIAPRFHTNQNTLIKYLIQHKYVVSFYVTRIGHSEDHTVIKPRIINQSNLFNLIKWTFTSSNHLFNYLYGIPSLNDLISFIKEEYDVIIIRNPNNLLAFIFAVISRVNGVKIIFYTQRQVYRRPMRLKDTLTLLYMKIFDANWISPCLGSSSHTRISNKLDYLPFCMYKHKYEKNWFKKTTVNILDIGKFTERKNHHILIEALHQLEFKFNFTLTIIGEATNGSHLKYLSKIKGMAEKCNFKINIITNVKTENVFKYYMEHDVFIIPSINEPASVSNLEAMSFGLPVIISDTNNTSCYSVNGYNGYVFRSGDVTDLKLKIELLLEDRERIIRMGGNSSKLINDRHNPKIIYGAYFNKFEYQKNI